MTEAEKTEDPEHRRTGPWDSEHEKLMCFMVLDDDVASLLSPTAGEAYWRAFIIQDRETLSVSAKMRFCYQDGTRSWYRLAPDNSGIEPAAMVEHLRCSLEDTLNLGLATFTKGTADSSIHCFYPPDDDGNPARTILWLEERDLIGISNIQRTDAIVPKPPEGEGDTHGRSDAS